MSYNKEVGTLFALLILHNVKLSARKAESVLFSTLWFTLLIVSVDEMRCAHLMLFISERSSEMVKIKIGSEERNKEEVDSSWINQQINRGRNDGPVCVRVTIKNDAVNMILSSGDCPRNDGGRRTPRTQEKEIFDLWDIHGLNEAGFPSGHLVAFITKLQKLF